MSRRTADVPPDVTDAERAERVIKLLIPYWHGKDAIIPGAGAQIDKLEDDDGDGDEVD